MNTLLPMQQRLTHGNTLHGMIRRLGHWSQTGCLLALILLIGGEYKITHTSGRVSFCRIKGLTADGDYVVQHPKKILGYNAGRIPIILWNKEDVLLSAFDISEAKLLKQPTPTQDNSWNRLSGTSYHTPPTWLPTNSELSKPLYEK